MGTRAAREGGRGKDRRGQGTKESRRERGRESRKREGKVEVLVEEGHRGKREGLQMSQ